MADQYGPPTVKMLLEDIESLRAKYLYALPDNLRVEAQKDTAYSAFATLRHIELYFEQMAHFREVMEAERGQP